jgi:hypothetical protein
MNKFTKIMEAKSNSTWRIGLDLHGVITDMPEFFSFFTNAMIAAGAEVHIVTGGATESDKELLKNYNIKYTHFFSIVDHHRKIGTPTSGKHPKYGFDMISDEEWDKTKGEYCRQHNIDLHIDDTLIYNNFFTTPFCRLWSHSNMPKPEHKDPRHLA